MKIAVDAQSIGVFKTGIGVAALHLVEAMKTEAPEIEFLLYQKACANLNTPRRLVWENLEIPRRVLRDKPDWMYSPGFAPAYFCAAPQIVTVHDLIGMAYPGNQGAVSSFYWSVWLPRALRRARKIVASSQHTRQDIERFLKIPPSQVQVVPLGVSPVFRRLVDLEEVSGVLKELGIQKPFFIGVSTIETRKNHLGLLRAYSLLKQRQKNSFSLVLVGKPGSGSAKVSEFIAENGLAEHVHLLGYVPDEKLNLLYNAALGYVMVSFYEGFGLPVLEAMSCGLPGVIANNTSLPEVAGDTALLVDPHQPEQIADALSRVSENASLRSDLGQLALRRSQQFSIQNTARQMIRIFKGQENL